MSAPLDTLETQLVRDLEHLSDRFGDDEFCRDLYRGLTNRTLTRQEEPKGHLVLSWTRAEAFVNDLRAREHHNPLVLAQSGGEGVVSETVNDELARHGWRSRPLNTGRHDARHSGQPESPPPAGTGERRSAVEGSEEWAREAHAAADRARHGRLP